MSIKSKYFIIAIVIMGSIGIWLPIGLEALINKTFTFTNVPQNVTTYFVSLLFAGCIDYFLGKIKELNIKGLANTFLNLLFIGLIGIVIVVGAIILNVYKFDKLSLFLGIIGVFISYKIWWIANDNNPNFIENDAPLGGDTKKQLVNG